QLTDRVTVQVSRVDLDARKIDLRLVTEPGIKTVLKNEARRADSEQQAREQKQAGHSDKPARRGKSGGAAADSAKAPKAFSKAGKKKR
ncbi:MAG: ribonuclease R, partial [Pseudomonadota bacterium]|nr:ribonuclease R [Pseudomonadota bacterium]